EGDVEGLGAVAVEHGGDLAGGAQTAGEALAEVVAHVSDKVVRELGGARDGRASCAAGLLTHGDSPSCGPGPLSCVDSTRTHGHGPSRVVLREDRAKPCSPRR